MGGRLYLVAIGKPQLLAEGDLTEHPVAGQLRGRARIVCDHRRRSKQSRRRAGDRASAGGSVRSGSVFRVCMAGGSVASRLTWRRAGAQRRQRAATGPRTAAGRRGSRSARQWTIAVPGLTEERGGASWRYPGGYPVSRCGFIQNLQAIAVMA